MKKLLYTLLLFPAIVCAQPNNQEQSNKMAAPNSAVRTTLSLDSCKILAITNNYSLKEAASEVYQSEQVKQNAFTNYFPKINAGFSAVKMSDYLIKSSIPMMNLPVYNGNPATIPTATQFTYFPGMQINLLDYMNLGYVMAAQPIFTGGRIYNGNKLAKTGYEISNEKKLMTETEVLVKTEELYWNIISLNKKLVTVDSYLKLLKNLFNDVSNAYNAGLVQRTDLLQVQLKQNELEGNRLKLTDGIALSKKALCKHIGIQFDNELILTDTIAIISDPKTIFVNPDEAVKNRNEFKMLEKAVKAEVLQQKMVTGEYLPQVSVGVAGLYNDIMDNADEYGVLFATVSVPISDWWGGSHKIKESKAKVENANYKLSETTDLLSLQITQSQNELSQSFFDIGNAEKSMDQAKENLKVTTDNYNAGISKMSDLLEAQSIYQNAINSLTEAKCSYQITKAKYMQVTGNYK
jgi:outer membrane protein TolC